MCDTCVNYVYDEDDESWVCCVDMDEDDYVRMLTSPKPDEYAVVRHQM